MTVTNDTMPGGLLWRRNCKIKGTRTIGCERHNLDGSGRLVDECICDTDLCNRDMGPIPDVTSTTVSTTTEGTHLL